MPTTTDLLTPTKTLPTWVTASKSCGWLWQRRYDEVNNKNAQCTPVHPTWMTLEAALAGCLRVSFPSADACLIVTSPTGDDALYQQACRRFKFAVELATDTVYGGAFRGMSSVRKSNCLVFTENLLENTDGVLRTPSVFARDGSLLPSGYADGRSSGDVIAF